MEHIVGLIICILLAFVITTLFEVVMKLTIRFHFWRKSKKEESHREIKTEVKEIIEQAIKGNYTLQEATEHVTALYED